MSLPKRHVLISLLFILTELKSCLKITTLLTSTVLRMEPSGSQQIFENKHGFVVIERDLG